jgi:hypothetical protein
MSALETEIRAHEHERGKTARSSRRGGSADLRAEEGDGALLEQIGALHERV